MTMKPRWSVATVIRAVICLTVIASAIEIAVTVFDDFSIETLWGLLIIGLPTLGPAVVIGWASTSALGCGKRHTWLAVAGLAFAFTSLLIPLATLIHMNHFHAPGAPPDMNPLGLVFLPIFANLGGLAIAIPVGLAAMLIQRALNQPT